jgi:serine protease
MTYHGGPVQTAPKEYLLFYGRSSASADRVHDPDNVWAYGYSFLKAAEGSPWLKTVTQYYDRSGHIKNPRTQLRGTWWTKVLPPNPYSTQDIAQAAIAVANQVGYSPNSNYIVMTPTGFGFPGFGRSCSYHTAVITSKGPVSFTVLPYIPNAGKGCGAYSVNRNGIDDGVSIILGHEAAETQTDPNLNAWFAKSIQGEVADLCAWRHLEDIKFPNGKTFPVQPLWSNASSRCVDHYLKK